MRKVRWAVLENLLGKAVRPSDPPALIVVGLGNPGEEYANTRHNVGFWCVDLLSSRHSIRLSRRHKLAALGEGGVEGHPVVLAKPRTFVNLSGEAVAYLLARYRVRPQALMVVYDDMELPLGALRLRPRGGAGGHNGIRSIIESLGTQDFPRLRVGIGQPETGGDRVAHVLGEMGAEERATADEAAERAAQAVTTVLSDGIDAAMNRFN